MGRETGISWTDSTWNPIRGCSRVSEGCRNCYAETIAGRFSGVGLPFEGLVTVGLPGKKSTKKWNGQIKFVEEHLLDPLKWKPILAGIRHGEGVLRQKEHRDGTVTVTRERPRRVFVNSMSDLFHENVTDEIRDKIFAVMALCPQHTFQVLTKRPERMLSYLTTLIRDDGHSAKSEVRMMYERPARFFPGEFARLPLNQDPFQMQWPLPNVHLGVSVEDQKTADLRIPLLLQTPAAVRFISAEPLLGPVNLDSRPISFDQSEACGECGSQVGSQDFFTATVHCGNPDCTSCGESLALGHIDWVIVGGESGAGARPMHPDWARSLRDQCKAAGVPYFFKQWGAWGPLENGETTLSGYDMDLTVHTFRDDLKPRSAWEDVFLTNAKTNGCRLDGVEHHEFPAVTA